MDYKQLLAQYLGVEKDEIEEMDGHNFDVGNESYWVGNYDEAYDEAVEMAENILDEIGLEALTSSARDFVLSNDRFVNQHDLEYYMEEDIRDYAYSLDVDELAEELYNDGKLDDDDFEVDEDGYIDFSTCKKSQDELVDLYYDKHSDEDAVDYWMNMLGLDGFADFVKNNNMVDMKEVAKYVVDEDGIAHQIASYDGDEIDLGEDDYGKEIYAYRVN